MRRKFTEKQILDAGFDLKKLESRFWAFVPQDNDGCWDWRGRRDTREYQGYGVIGVKKIRLRAHRLSWILHFGPIPDGLFVCHRCDNPPCVRPDHLYLGDCLKNIQDAVAKGRQNNRGSKNGSAKLNETQVAEIKRRIRSGESKAAVASAFGVSRPLISAINSGLLWRSVGNG